MRCVKAWPGMLPVFSKYWIVPSTFADEEVQVAIRIQVGKAGVAVLPTSTPLKGLRLPLRSMKAGLVALPVFSKVVDDHHFTDEGVQVAVLIQVGEGGCAASPNIHTIEGVEAAGAAR